MKNYIRQLVAIETEMDCAPLLEITYPRKITRKIRHIWEQAKLLNMTFLLSPTSSRPLFEPHLSCTSARRITSL
jgi:hypothetical protein